MSTNTTQASDVIERSIVETFVTAFDRRAVALVAQATKAEGGRRAMLLASARDLDACAASIAALLPADRAAEVPALPTSVTAERTPPSSIVSD